MTTDRPLIPRRVDRNVYYTDISVVSDECTRTLVLHKVHEKISHWAGSLCVHQRIIEQP